MSGVSGDVPGELLDGRRISGCFGDLHPVLEDFIRKFVRRQVPRAALD